MSVHCCGGGRDRASWIWVIVGFCSWHHFMEADVLNVLCLIKKKKRTGCHRFCHPKWKWISKYLSMLRLLSKNTQISWTTESFNINYPGPYKWMLDTKQMFCIKPEKNTLKFSTLAAAKYSLWSNFLFPVKITKAKQKCQTNPSFYLIFREPMQLHD